MDGVCLPRRCPQGVKQSEEFFGKCGSMTEENKGVIQIRLEAYDHKMLDRSAQEIIATARNTDAEVSGPIPLPTRIERYTVLRSPHVDKKSREQFEIRTHKRLIYLTKSNPKTIDALGKLAMPAGVHIRIKA